MGHFIFVSKNIFLVFYSLYNKKFVFCTLLLSQLFVAASFIRVVGSEFVQKYLGEGPRMVRDVFRLAKENAPAIIFIDEIDAIATKRFDAQTGGKCSLLHLKSITVQSCYVQVLSFLLTFVSRIYLIKSSVFHQIDYLKWHQILSKIIYILNKGLTVNGFI